MTAVAPERPAPVSVTVWPPDTESDAGSTEVTAGEDPEAAGCPSAPAPRVARGRLLTGAGGEDGGHGDRERGGEDAAAADVGGHVVLRG